MEYSIRQEQILFILFTDQCMCVFKAILKKDTDRILTELDRITI